MAKTFPVGHMRVNPNTFLTEVWDGNQWIGNLTTGANLSGSSYTLASNGNNTVTTSTVRPTYSPTEKELIFEFLKDNMRVAEYRDGNGKIETVELQLRLDVGYEWEPIKRTKIIRSKLT